MEINIPESAEQWLKTQATQAGFNDVQEYALSILMSQAAPNETAPNEPANRRSFYEAAEASGLIGGGSEYASDLSSNPKHLEGFGR